VQIHSEAKMMDLNLAGRTVLVTGASKGIGLAIARWFAREGCHLHLAARSQDLLEREAAAMRKNDAVEVRIHALDLSQDARRSRLTEACPEVDVLVNNAGDVPAGSLEDIDDASWRAGWDLKVFGYIGLTRFYLAKMKARRRGVIVNIIGTAGERPQAGYIAGSMGNSTLMSFTIALGAASPDYGVRVLGVNPGPTLTDRVIKISKKRAQQTLGDVSIESLLQAPFGAHPAESALLEATKKTPGLMDFLQRQAYDMIDEALGALFTAQINLGLFRREELETLMERTAGLFAQEGWENFQAVGKAERRRLAESLHSLAVETLGEIDTPERRAEIFSTARQRVKELSRQKEREGGLAAALAVLLSEETPLGESSIMTRAFLGEMFSAVKRQAREE